MKPVNTWIVLADATTFRLAANQGPGKGVYGLPDPGLVAPPVTALSDEPGMTNAPAGPNRGGISHPDLKGQAQAGFADVIVRFLDAARRKKRFQRFILIAPPAMLGVLRQQLTPQLQDVLHADIAKDLTHVPLDDLPGHLADVLAV